MKKTVQITGHDLEEIMSMPEEERKHYLEEVEVSEEKVEKDKKE
jgi:hypothetical protein